ncbi:MAG: glycosyltransferase family 4 protein [Chloroflexi bacterium]|nr:glycosyltransferase family 4 protein [Chloroflexota bacterium]
MVSKRQNRLLVINQYYTPDVASTGQYAAEICEDLAREGFEIHVVTGQPSYTVSSPDAPPFEVRNGVYVYRVPLGRSRGRERMRTRLAGYMRFLVGAWWQARRLVRSKPFDLVMTFHNPPFVPLIGAYLASRYGLRYVYVPYDIHPDVLLATGWRLPAPLVRLWEGLNRWVFSHASAVVVLGEGMKRTLVEGKGVPREKVWVIPLWGRPELKPVPRAQSIREELGIKENELLLLYAGNMGILHPLEPIIDAAALLQGLPVRILFLGDGAKRERLVRRVEKEGIGQVNFLPYQPEERFARLVAAADGCLVVLEAGLERFALPSRAFTFLSAGRPLITLMAPDADVARLVTETGCGWNVTSGQELADLVRELLEDRQEVLRRGRRAREIYDERFRRDRVIRAYAGVFEAVLNQRT